MGVVETCAALLVRALVLPVEWVGKRQQTATTRRLALDTARTECGCGWCTSFVEDCRGPH